MHTDGKLLLSIRQLTKRYGDKTILESLNLDLYKGEVVVILGPSGSGKSTLLRCVNGLEEKQGGSIVMDANSAKTCRGKPRGRKSAWCSKVTNSSPT